MKKACYLFSCLIIAVLLFSTCKKDDDNPTVNDSIVLAQNAIVIDNPTSQIIQSVDSSTVIFDGNTAQLQGLDIGDIIVSGIAPNAPYGFLRRIIGKTVNNNNYIFNTEDAMLTDAFTELHIDYTKEFSLSDSAGKLASPQFSIDYPEQVLYDADNNLNTTNDQIKLNGGITLVPSLHVNIDISLAHVDYVLIEAGFNSDFSNQITIGGALASFNKEIQIYQHPLTPFTIPGTPIVIVPVLRVNIGANGSVTAQIQATYTNTSDVSAYLKYENGGWINGFNKTMNNTFQYSGVQAAINAKAYIEPGIDFKFFGSNKAKGSIYTQGYAKFTGQILPSPGCELKAGVNAGAEAVLKIFGWQAAISYPDIFDYNTTLFTCNGTNTTPPTADFTASQTIINTGQSVNFSDLSTGSPTLWQWTFIGGTPNSSTQQSPTNISYSTPGTYNVSLTATNANGSNTKTVNGYITVNSIGADPIASFSATPTTVQVGQSVQFTDLTQNPGSWQWNFEGGTPPTSTSQNPIITYNTAGTYDVSLISTNVAGNDTELKSNYITVTNQQMGQPCQQATVTDINGNVYNTVQIGNQCWMKENLIVTSYNNGTPIELITDSITWLSVVTPAYTFYNSDISVSTTYGLLYNAYAISNNLCPQGWHVPADYEWQTLTTTLGGYNIAGGKLKEIGTTHWITPNTSATNETGFTALPGGQISNYSSSNSIGVRAYFWTKSNNGATNKRFAVLHNNLESVTIGSGYFNYGMSIRCVKD